MNLYPITEHAYEVRKVMKYLHFIHGKDPQGLMIDWLNMAAGVSKVEIVTEKYDSSIYLCESALAYERDRSYLWSELSQELISFNFIWGSLEYLIKDMCDKYGKASTTMRGRIFLRNNYKYDVIPEYEISYYRLLEFMLSNMSEEIPNDFDDESFIAKGLILTSKVRNMFAHGSRGLPEIEDYSEGLSIDIELINLSSRITLFIIQMILIIKYYDSNEYIESPYIYDFFLPFRFDEVEDPLSLNKVMFNLHLEHYLHYIKNEQLFFKL